MKAPVAVLALVILAAIPGAPRASRGSESPVLTLQAEEFPELVAFYRDVLGFPLRGSDGAVGRAVLDARGVTLVISTGGKAARREGAARVLFPSSDLAADRERLERGRVEYRVVQPEGSGPRALLFGDPEGNAVGFVESGLPETSWLLPQTVLAGARGPVDTGRTRLKIFGGLYGIWLGVAVPVGLGADGPAPIGAGMLLGGPLGVIAAHNIARGSDMGKGRAGLIAHAGSWGTWQGLGWAAEADADGEAVLLTGVGAGLMSLATTILVTEDMAISEGQSTIITTASGWGAWYGLVGAMLSEESDDDVLPAMLAGSAAGLAAGALWCSGHDITANRARLISLGGAIGAGAGFGVDLIAEVDDTETAFLIAGIGSLAGKILTAVSTRDEPEAERAEAVRPGLDFGLTFGLGPHGATRITVVHASF